MYTYNSYIQIKDSQSVWRYVKVENWDKVREEMLCQFLGFGGIEYRYFYWTSTFRLTGYNIATGDLICYKRPSNETSCCVHLTPSKTERPILMPLAWCKYTLMMASIVSFVQCDCTRTCFVQYNCKRESFKNNIKQFDYVLICIR